MEIVALLIFAFIDYVGFNWTPKSKPWIVVYRIIQGLFHGGFTVGIAFLGGWSFNAWMSALHFNLLWWFFWADLLYYLFYDLLRWFGDKRGMALVEDVLQDNVTWAWWTPLGIIRGGKSDIPIRGRDILFQAFIGFILYALLKSFV